jgi:RND family efflux transporter MFP subunit
MPSRPRPLLLLLLTVLALAACGRKPPPPAEGRVVNITVARVDRRGVEETELTVGRLESMAAPPVSAEVAGRVVRIVRDEGQTADKGQVLAEIDSRQYRLGNTVDQSEAARLAALAHNKESDYERAKRLFERKLISQEQLDTVATDLAALREQVKGAEARAADSSRRLGDASVVAPFKGEIARRRVNVGEYVQVGTALFDLVDMEHLRVRLPFPEGRAPQLRTGLDVRLTSAASGTEGVTARVTEVQPGVNANNRSISVIVDFANPGRGRPGASVRGEVVLRVRPDALMVPQVAVVRRPAGDVVYVVDGGKAREQLVRRGERNGDLVEIVEGLKGGETVAVDGAGFLSNGASVKAVGG